MQYLDCPRCGARFHTGFIYVQLEVCPRCGAAFQEPPSDRAGRLRHAFGHHATSNAIDWETITAAQYAGRGITRTVRRPDRQRESEFKEPSNT